MTFSARLLRRLGCGLTVAILAPFLSLGLVLVGPVGEAAAALKVGPAMGFTWQDSAGPIPGVSIECTGTAYYRFQGSSTQGVQHVVLKGIDCDTGPMYDVRTGFFEVYVNGETADGANSCQMASAARFDGSQDETVPDLSVGGRDVVHGTECNVQELCFNVKDDPPWNIAQVTTSGCIDFNMGAMPWPGEGPAATGCDLWSQTGWAYSYRNREDGDTYWQYRKLRALGFQQKGTYSMWLLSVHRVGGQLYVHVWSDGLAPGETFKEFMGGAGQWAPWGTLGSGEDFAGSMIGVQVYENTRTAMPGARGPYFDPQSFHGRIPEQGGSLGTTSAERCSFYYGEKITNLSATDEDEPAGVLTKSDTDPEGPVDDVEPGPVNDPPSSDQAGCNFDILSPSTWLEGGMCALVGLFRAMLSLLGQVLDAIGRLAAAIVTPLLDFLRWLLIPSEDLFDGWDDLRAQAEARAPFSVVVELGQAGGSVVSGFTSSGDCGVLTTFDIPGASAQVDCESLKAAPGWGALYALMVAALGVTTLFMCINLVRSSIQ